MPNPNEPGQPNPNPKPKPTNSRRSHPISRRRSGDPVRAQVLWLALFLRLLECNTQQQLNRLNRPALPHGVLPLSHMLGLLAALIESVCLRLQQLGDLVDDHGGDSSLSQAPDE